MPADSENNGRHRGRLKDTTCLGQAGRWANGSERDSLSSEPQSTTGVSVSASSLVAAGWTLRHRRLGANQRLVSGWAEPSDDRP